jgi:hypothetical protein
VGPRLPEGPSTLTSTSTSTVRAAANPPSHSRRRAVQEKDLAGTLVDSGEGLGGGLATGALPEVPLGREPLVRVGLAVPPGAQEGLLGDRLARARWASAAE